MIKPEEFEAEQSRVQDIYMFLKNKGYDVYFPSQKIGDCTKPYVVVKSNGTSKHLSFSTDIDQYSIMVYVPQKSYSQLEVLVRQIRQDMKELEPMIMYNNSMMASFYDDSIKGHMTSIEFKNYKKL